MTRRRGELSLELCDEASQARFIAVRFRPNLKVAAGDFTGSPAHSDVSVCGPR